MKNIFERGPEQIPTKEAVLDIIKGFEENTAIIREESDEQGLYLLEANVNGENPGEYTQYQYMRAGNFKEGQSLETVIHVVYYQDDIPCGGHDVATFRSQTGIWEVEKK